MKAVCFGEILLDVFPDKERIGGAPLNVASRLSSQGISVQMISRVGRDREGDAIVSYLHTAGVGTGMVGKDSVHPTGVVNVTLSGSGSATYEIAYPSAWDKIPWTKDVEQAVRSSDVFIFGSLVCRDEVSSTTLFKLLSHARYKVLDFNLRPPHYNRETLLKLISKADFIKFNDDELFEISQLMGSRFNSLEQNVRFIADHTSAKTVCVTKGKHGAVLWHKEKLYYNSGYKIRVRDTVGAGDSFLATLIANLLKEKPVQESLDHACAVGALIASRDGANPELSPKTVEEFMFPKDKAGGE